MILGIVAGLVWAVARVSVPLLAGAAIDHGIAEGRTGDASPWRFRRWRFNPR